MCMVLWPATGSALACVTPSEVCQALGNHTAEVSSDGKWVLRADGAAGSMAILDGQLNPVRHLAASSWDGRKTAHTITVHDAPPRSSFVIVLHDVGEIWEISYNPQAESLFEGLVHDYRMGEGLATPGFWGVRRTQLPSTPAPLATLYFSADFRNLFYLRPDPVDNTHHAVVVNLDVRRAIADLPLSETPPPGSSLTLAWGSRTLRVAPASTDNSLASDVRNRYCVP